MEGEHEWSERFDTSPVCRDQCGVRLKQNLDFNALQVNFFRLKETENGEAENSKSDKFSTSLPVDQDYKPIVTKTLSFRSNRTMWENIEKEREQSQALDRPKKKPSNNCVAAPDLLQDLLESSLVGPAVRSRADSDMGAGRIDSGQDVPDGTGEDEEAYTEE